MKLRTLLMAGLVTLSLTLPASALTLSVDGASVTSAALLANGNYYLPASFFTSIGVQVG